MKLSGEKFALDYDPSSDTVEDIKLAVEEEWKIEPAKQRLLFGGQILKDEKHIQFYNVPEDAVIQVAPMMGADPAEPPPPVVPKGILKNTSKADDDDEEEEEEEGSSGTRLQRNSSSTSASNPRQSSSGQSSSRSDRRSAAPTRPRNKMDKKELRIRDEVDELRDVTATWTRAFEREHNRKPTPKDLPKDIAKRFKKLFELEEILKIEYGG